MGVFKFKLDRAPVVCTGIVFIVFMAIRKINKVGSFVLTPLIAGVDQTLCFHRFSPHRNILYYILQRHRRCGIIKCCPRKSIILGLVLPGHLIKKTIKIN